MERRYFLLNLRWEVKCRSMHDQPLHIHAQAYSQILLVKVSDLQRSFLGENNV